MPYDSDQQRKFFHSAGAKKAGIDKKTVREFDDASRGMKLPKKKGKFDRVKKMFGGGDC